MKVPVWVLVHPGPFAYCLQVGRLVLRNNMSFYWFGTKQLAFFSDLELAKALGNSD